MRRRADLDVSWDKGNESSDETKRRDINDENISTVAISNQFEFVGMEEMTTLVLDSKASWGAL